MPMSHTESLVEALKRFMAAKDLTIHDIAGMIKRDPKTVWRFLHSEVTPQDRTLYRIKHLLERKGELR